MSSDVINVLIAGLGGQGIVKASDILAEAAFRAGFDVKKNEVHGMSQRGGSVTSEVRFGSEVLSPMIPAGEVDYLVALDADQVSLHFDLLRQGGAVLTPGDIGEASGPGRKSLNVAMLGALSRLLPLEENHWLDALKALFAEKHHAANAQAFAAGRMANGHHGEETK
jgi:indolepyruvate ferredoxin oxidoreductase, beta subunit